MKVAPLFSSSDRWELKPNRQLGGGRGGIQTPAWGTPSGSSLTLSLPLEWQSWMERQTSSGLSLLLHRGGNEAQRDSSLLKVSQQASHRA